MVTKATDWARNRPNLQQKGVGRAITDEFAKHKNSATRHLIYGLFLRIPGKSLHWDLFIGREILARELQCMSTRRG